MHSAIDWTWFVPGNVVPGAAARGLGRRAAGRCARGSPRAEAAGRRAAAAAAEQPRSRWRRLAPAPLAGCSPRWRSRPRWSPPGRPTSPCASAHAGDAALEQLDQGAYEQAVATAQIAVDRNPLSVDPLFELAAIQQGRGQTPEAKAALIRATEVQPANAEAWRRLGQFRLDALAEPRTALKDFQVAYYLDPQNPRSWTDLIVATRAVQADGG